MKEKVMVFEVKEKTFIALSSSGEFIEKPLVKDLEVGDYTYITSSIDKKIKSFDKAKKLNYYPILKVAAVILIAISLVLLMQDNVRVIATIDINPSFEFHLNDNDEIIKAVPRSLEAEKIDKEVTFKGYSYKEGLTILLTESIERGYIRQDKQNLVIVSMFDKDGKDIDLNKKEISSEIVKKVSQDKKLDLVVASYDVDKDDYEKAKELKTSVNKVVATKKAKELGVDINQEELNNKSIVDLAKDQGIAPGDLISEKAKIDQVEAAPPGLTKKDILPFGHLNDKDVDDESENDNEDSENNKNNQADNKFPPGLNKDDSDNRLPPGLDKQDNDDQVEKDKDSEAINENNQKGNKPDSPPGIDKKNNTIEEELEEELEENESENSNKDSPLGMQKDKDLPPGLSEDKPNLKDDIANDKNQGKKDESEEEIDLDEAEEEDEDEDEDEEEDRDEEKEEDKGLDKPNENNPGEDKNSPGNNPNSGNKEKLTNEDTIEDVIEESNPKPNDKKNDSKGKNKDN